MSYLITHWRGHQPLWRAFWVNGVALRVMIYLALLSLARLAPLSVFLVGSIVLADLALLVWQGVGYFRTAERNQHGLGTILPLWGGMCGLIVVVFVVISQWWALVLMTDPYAPGEPYSEKRNRLYAAQYDLRVEEGHFRFHGKISIGSTDRLRDLIETHPDITRLDLDSPGGHIFEARGLARLVQEYGLSTHVARDCSSACTLVFVAGVSRHLDDGAKLGFHSYALTDAKWHPGFDVAAEHARDQAYFRAQDVSDSFVARIYDTPSNEIWFPTRAELLAARILTQAP